MLPAINRSKVSGQAEGAVLAEGKEGSEAGILELWGRKSRHWVVAGCGVYSNFLSSIVGVRRISLSRAYAYGLFCLA